MTARAAPDANRSGPNLPEDRPFDRLFDYYKARETSGFVDLYFSDIGVSPSATILGTLSPVSLGIEVATHAYVHARVGVDCPPEDISWCICQIGPGIPLEVMEHNCPVRLPYEDEVRYLAIDEYGTIFDPDGGSRCRVGLLTTISGDELMVIAIEVAP